MVSMAVAGLWPKVSIAAASLFLRLSMGVAGCGYDVTMGINEVMTVAMLLSMVSTTCISING